VQKASTVSERDNREHGESEVDHHGRSRCGEPNEDRYPIPDGYRPKLSAFGLQFHVDFAVLVEVLASGDTRREQ
jgi:hypothetical protein